MLRDFDFFFITEFDIDPGIYLAYHAEACLSFAFKLGMVFILYVW